MTNTSTRDRVDRRTRDESETADEAATELSCPECGGSLETNAAQGETVCSECGLVVKEDEIDRGPEWRAFDSTEKDEKIGRAHV